MFLKVFLGFQKDQGKEGQGGASNKGLKGL